MIFNVIQYKDPCFIMYWWIGVDAVTRKITREKKSSKIQKAFLYVLYLAPLNNLDEVQICVVLVPEYPAQLVALLRGVQLTHVGADEAALVNRAT